MSWDALREKHDQEERRAEEGGGAAKLARQKRLDRLTVRERIDALIDEGSFVEIERQTSADGVVCGIACVDGRSVGVIAHDATVARGTVGRAAAHKMTRVMDLAARGGFPVVTLADSEGARVAENIDAIDAYGATIRGVVALRRDVLQITLVCGLCVGGAAYAATLNDWVAMVDERSFMFVTGGKVTRVAVGEDASIEDLGGARMHARFTGACHAVVADERAGIAWVKRLLSFAVPVVPSADPVERETREIEDVVPTDPRRTYDMRGVVRAICDEGSTLELSEDFGKSLLTVLGRIGGKRVAIVASQPKNVAGALDVDASRKGAHFVMWASKMQIPIVTLVDVPGYLPGLEQERGGIIPFGALLLVAYGEAKVPHVCVVVRKCFGGAAVLSFTASIRLALPTARIAPMGVDAAMEVVAGAERETWLAENDHGWAAAEQGYIDRVITPASVRQELARALASLE